MLWTEKDEVPQYIKDIGGGRLADVVVDAGVKAAVLSCLWREHHIFVTTLGDSPHDLDMLSKANQAIVLLRSLWKCPIQSLSCLLARSSRPNSSLTGFAVARCFACRSVWASSSSYLRLCLVSVKIVLFKCPKTFVRDKGLDTLALSQLVDGLGGFD